MRAHRPWLVLALAALAGCLRTGRNYPDADVPRYVGAPHNTPQWRLSGDTLRIVSFNVKFSLRIDSAIAVLQSDSVLRRADIVLLQEMDTVATRRIAEALNAWYVYYPAIFHLRANKQFGNAIIARWPIVEDAKLILPHQSRYAGTQRTATAATIRVGTTLIRAYSTHLGTPLDVSSAARRNQLLAILRDAERYEHVIVGGDLNSKSVGDVARELGYEWPTRLGARTTPLGRWDHIFLRGLGSPDHNAAGTVLDARKSSDHLPVWAIALLP